MRRLLIFGCLIVTLVGLTGCTARYDFTECQSDEDCRSFEEPADGRFLTCSSDNTCQSASGIECRADGHCSGGATCSEANECVGGMGDAGDAGDGSDGGDGGDTSQDGGDAPGCQTNTECIDRNGEGFVCGAEGTCVEATNELCPSISYPNEQRDNVVILGSIIPTSGPFENVGTTLTNAIQMAVGEFFNSARSLPSGQKIAWLQCDSKGSGDLAKQAARHLAKVGAPAIIGPMLSQNYLNVVDQVTADAGIVTIAPAATSPAITNLSAAGTLSFRTIGNDRFQSSALLDRLETLVGDEANPQVTVFYKDDQYGRDFQSELLDLVLDANWIDKSSFAFLKTVDPVKVMDEQKVAMNFASQVTTALNDRQPGADVVVFIGTSETIDLASLYIKTARMGSQQTNPLNRRYIFSHGAVSDIPDLVGALKGNEAFVPLVEGISPQVIDRDNYPPFNSRYNAQFNQELTASAAGVAYDATNLAMLAMAGIPDGEPLTGGNIGEVISSGKLEDSDGTTIEFGESGFQGTANSELGDGNTVDLQGVSGNLDLNDDGEVRSDYIGIDEGMKRDIGGNIVYDIVPTRLYRLDAEPATSGSWNPIPPGFQTPGVVKMKRPMKPIPDADMAGVTDEADINGCGTVNIAHVNVSISHPDRAELTVELTSPGGQTVPLHVGGSDAGADLQGTYPTTLLPSGDLSKVLAEPGNGTWTLKVVDTGSEKASGMLAGWGLQLYCGQ